MDDKFDIELTPNDVFNVSMGNVVNHIGDAVDYNQMQNKPKINDVILQGNKSLDDIGAQPKGDYPSHALTNLELEALLN